MLLDRIQARLNMMWRSWARPAIYTPRRVSRLSLRLVIIVVLALLSSKLLVFLTGMKLSNILPLAGAALVASQSTSVTTSSYSAPLPSGSVPPARYDGLWRPQVHFSSPQGFINDPNGLFIDSEQVWHLYYQFNPSERTVAGNQTWGHATSKDLYRWEVQPIALAPTNGTDLVFSGSAVVDSNNTSGFFPNQTNGVVAIFTTAGPNQQVQDIAYSYDNGYTFMRYEANPVLSIGSANFRDPKVIWHQPTNRWVMVIAFSQEFSIGIYTSQNLRNWTFASNFSYHGVIGYQYECPNMVQMPMEGQTEPMWLMYLSINPGAPYGGSIGEYYPGSFNGTHFTAVDSVARIADFGKDNYASQFWYGIPSNQPQLSIGWASNWAYTNRVPTGPAEGWASAFTLPRINYLRNATRIGYQLVSQPYNLRSRLPASPLVQNNNLGNNSIATRFGQNPGSGAIFLDVNVTGLNTSAAPFASSINFTVTSSSSGESFSGGQLFGGDNFFFMDRGKLVGFEDPFFTDKFSQSFLFNDTYDMQLIVDRSVAEAFILRGEKSATLSIFPQAALDTITVSTFGINPGARVSVAIWELNSAWTANSTGYVNGNSTRQLVARSFKV